MNAFLKDFLSSVIDRKIQNLSRFTDGSRTFTSNKISGKIFRITALDKHDNYRRKKYEVKYLTPSACSV
jgi:hypothetical protein